jgi:hypothetical protein
MLNRKKRAMKLPNVIYAVISFALVARTGIVWGAPPSEVGGTEQAVEKPILGLHIATAFKSIDANSLKSAIESELSVKTADVPDFNYPLGRLTVDSENGESAVVRFESADGATKIERRILLPKEGRRRVSVIAWVSGNLVRNEAAEILATYQTKTETGVSAKEIVSENASVTDGDTSGILQATESKARTPELTSTAIPKGKSSISLEKRRFVIGSDSDFTGKFESTRFFHAALFSPKLALHSDARLKRYALSFGGIYSDIGSLNGFGLGLLVDKIENDARGVQISGIWISGAAHQGALIAGIGVHSQGTLYGVETSGLVTMRSGRVSGVQATGVLAISGEGCKIQHPKPTPEDCIAVKGVQLAGLSSYSRGSVTGLQMSSVFNYAQAGLDGGQISAGVNVARDAAGVQVGILNIARDVKGLQLGLVNIAKTNRGLALGLFNWSNDAIVHPIYFFQSPGYHNVGYRVRSGYSTGSISFGYDQPRQRARTHFAVGACTSVRRFGFGIESGYGWVLENFDSGPTDRAHELDLTTLLSVAIVPNVVSIFGGGGVRLPVAGTVPIAPHGFSQFGISFF